MHIGYDIDGVLTKRDYTHFSTFGVRSLILFAQTYFPQIIRHWTLSQPLQDDIQLAREIADEHTISIITARAEIFRHYTTQWLRNVVKIDYNQIYFVGLKKGFAERKLAIAQEIGLDLLLDDTEQTVNLFQKNGISAQLFQDWQTAKKYIQQL